MPDETRNNKMYNHDFGLNKNFSELCIIWFRKWKMRFFLYSGGKNTSREREPRLKPDKSLWLMKFQGWRDCQVIARGLTSPDNATANETKWLHRQSSEKLLCASHEKRQFCRIKLNIVLRSEIQWKMRKHSHNNLLSTTSIYIQFFSLSLELFFLSILITKCTLESPRNESMATRKKSPMEIKVRKGMIQRKFSLLFCIFSSSPRWWKKNVRAPQANDGTEAAKL